MIFYVRIPNMEKNKGGAYLNFSSHLGNAYSNFRAGCMLNESAGHIPEDFTY